MKFKVTFKTPDAVDYAIEDLSEDEQAEAKETARKFVEYGEYVVVEFDTETQTATVLPTR